MTQLIVCNTCKKKLNVNPEAEFTFELAKLYEDNAVYETAVYSYFNDQQKAEAMTCPRCGVSDITSEHALWMYTPEVFVRGSGLVNDRAGAKRDMNIFHLTAKDETGKTIDPYHDMRQPGEVDDMVKKFKKPKITKKNYADMGNIKEMETAVTKSVSQ